MKSIQTIPELRQALSGARRGGAYAGFVPTMGSLHDGHMSLVRAAREGNDLVVLSIFVNPVQFDSADDFEGYPRNLDQDLDLAEKAGVDFVFAPASTEMYPASQESLTVSAGKFDEVGEGPRRPGHLSGVATVCLKLFNIVQPDRVYFGEKDAQQLALIRCLVMAFNLPIEVVECPTVRDPDGLAMSSRNANLTGRERQAAAVLPKALFAARDAVGEGERSANKLTGLVENLLHDEPGLELDYVQAFDPVHFQAVEKVSEGSVIAAAAFAGKTRLLDSITVKLES